MQRPKIFMMFFYDFPSTNYQRQGRIGPAAPPPLRAVGHAFFYELIQGRPQDLGGGGQEFFFQIWNFACREATCCAWRSHAHC